MKDSLKEFWYWYGGVVLLILSIIIVSALVVYGGVKLDEASCIAKTQEMGFSSRWSFLGGCQIEVVGGQWIPLESYYFKQE